MPAAASTVERNVLCRAATVASLLVLVLLTGCGGGGSSASLAGGASAPSPDALSGPAPDLTAAALVGAADIEIDSYAIVSSTRVSRTVVEYTFTADASNWGSSDATVTATLASTSPATIVVEGAVDFGAVGRGATQEALDTFTIRQDRSQPFNAKALAWTVQATELPPTTIDLIDQALAAHVIDAETALVYKVFAEVGDERLPEEYRGRSDGNFEAAARGDAEVQFATLSPATQQLLAPLLELPDVSGVPLGAEPTGATGPRAQAAAGESGPRVAAAAAPVSWSGKWAVTNEVVVYWQDDAIIGETVADLMIAEIRGAIWTKLTTLFGHPLANRPIEVFIEEGEQETSFATSKICTVNPQVHIAPQHQTLKYVLVHELTHALLYYRYPAVTGCNQGGEYRWMHEATAKWSEHFIYPTTMNNREHEVAPFFLHVPEWELEYFGEKHQYGAYLWFLFISKGKTSATDTDVRRVADTWEWTASNRSLQAVDAAVSDLGGLEKQWPEFALYNWNRMGSPADAPYRYYHKWDKLRHKAKESTSRVAPSGYQAPKFVELDGIIYKGFPMHHYINHLGAKYWHYDFTYDDKIRRVRLIHPYANGSQPTAKVQVIAKIKDKDWMPAEDWTGYERKTLCRDKPEEDVQELVVIITDSEFNNRAHALDDGGENGPAQGTFLELSALGCTNWVGTVDFSAEKTESGIHMKETGKATNVRWEIETDRFSAQLFKPVAGTVNWHHVASGQHDDGDSCAGDSEGEYSIAGTAAGQYAFEMSGVFGTTPPLKPVYNMWGFKFGEPGPEDYVCQDAQEPFEPYFESPIYGTHDIWLDFGDRLLNAQSPGLYESNDPGRTLWGLAILQDEFSNGKVRTYGWLINQDQNAATRHKGFEQEPEL